MAIHLTCNMGSHSVTCHPTQANTPRLNPSHTGWYSIYLPRRDGRLIWPRWLIMRRPEVEPLTLGSRVWHANHYTTKPPKHFTFTSLLHITGIIIIRIIRILGPMHESAPRQFLVDLGRKITARSGEDREGIFLFQRISVLLHDSFISVHCPDWVSLFFYIPNFLHTLGIFQGLKK